MKKFKMMNEKFGSHEGPYQADSKYELANEMTPTFTDWARGDYHSTLNDTDLNEFDFIEQSVEKMREEFIKSLEEI